MNVETKKPGHHRPGANPTRVVLDCAIVQRTCLARAGQDLQLASMDAPDLLPAGSMTTDRVCRRPVIPHGNQCPALSERWHV